jgi:hypothetical protein
MRLLENIIKFFVVDDDSFFFSCDTFIRLRQFLLRNRIIKERFHTCSFGLSYENVTTAVIG